MREERHMNSKAAQELPDSVLIADSLRAVLSNYIQREKYQKRANFDTVIQDRIVSVKSFLKERKAKSFLGLTILSVPATFMAAVLGAFDSLTMILIIAGGIFGLSFVGQAYRAFIIRGNIGTSRDYEKIGVKKAFYDIFFETITSVQLVYYYTLLVLFFFIALAFLNIPVMDLLEYGIFKLGLLIMGTLHITEVRFHPKLIYVLIFAYPAAYVLGDYMHWKIRYGGVQRRYGDHD